MKKILSVLAVALLVVGLTGCLDDPDTDGMRISSSTSSVQL